MIGARRWVGRTAPLAAAHSWWHSSLATAAASKLRLQPSVRRSAALTS